MHTFFFIFFTLSSFLFLTPCLAEKTSDTVSFSVTESEADKDKKVAEAEPSEYQDADIKDGDFNDPLEPVNRMIFEVNDIADGALIKPVAHIYEDVTPEPLRKGISNFMDNIAFPIHFINFILQGRFEMAGHSLARFVVNTTMGVGGIFDPATEFELKKEKTGFGDTLGSWGVNGGPYLVLPVLGPSSFRGAIGTGTDTLTHPLYLAAKNKKVHGKLNKRHQLYKWYVGGRLVEAVNLRQQYLKTLDDLKEESIDEYTARRSLYAQQTLEKQKKIREDRKANTQEVSAEG